MSTTDTECSARVDDGTQCRRPVLARGLCGGHYQRMRTGKPVDGTLADGKRGCAVAGCPEKHFAKTFCWNHWRRNRQFGSPEGVSTYRDDAAFAGYVGAHDRVVSLRGKAREHTCVGCGGDAADWSYVGGCADEQVQVGGLNDGDAYCAHVEHYEPRCKPCHKRYDGHTALTLEQDSEVRVRYAAGETISQLASAYGVSMMTIHRRVRDISRGTRKKRVGQ